MYAIKRIKFGELQKKEIDNALNEVRLLASFDSPHILSKQHFQLDYREAFFDTSTREFCLVTEYAEGGDMQEYIKGYQKDKRHIPEKYIWSYIKQITTGNIIIRLRTGRAT